jgi:hypothetical protein
MNHHVLIPNSYFPGKQNGTTKKKNTFDVREHFALSKKWLTVTRMGCYQYVFL